MTARYPHALRYIRFAQTNCAPHVLRKFFLATLCIGCVICSSGHLNAQAVLVKDIRSGTNSANPANLTKVGSQLFFTATDGINGIELWKSDGTTSGTVMVKDINPGSASSLPAEFIEYNGLLIFNATDGTNGIELWRSDGTSAGTYMLKDINTGTSSSTPGISNFTRLSKNYLRGPDGLLYFTAVNASTGRELWKTDGSTVGTVLVNDIVSGSTGSDPRLIGSIGNEIIFGAEFSGTTGIEPYKLNVTNPAVVTLIKDINPGVFSSLDYNPLFPKPIKIGVNILFFAGTNDNGFEPWITDGTSIGTFMLQDINPGSASSLNSGQTNYEFFNIGSTIYFNANDGSNGLELWSTNGTTVSTQLVSDIIPGINGSNPREFISFNGSDANFIAGSGVNQLYRLNNPGTVELMSSQTFASTTGGELEYDAGFRGSFADFPSNKYFYYSGFNSADALGEELYFGFGSSLCYNLAYDINPGPASASPRRFTLIDNKLFFIADNADVGVELWMYNINKPPVGPETFNVVSRSTNSIDFHLAKSQCDLGDGIIVLRNTTQIPTDLPVDGQNYSVGQVIGSSTVAYVGNIPTFGSADFTDGSLSTASTYYYKAFSFAGTGVSRAYNTNNTLPLTSTTFQVQPSTQPTAFTFSSFTSSSLGCGFTAAAGSPSGYIVLRTNNGIPPENHFTPIDGTTYSVGTEIGSVTIVSVGNNISFEDTGLNPGSIHSYAVFSYNGAGAAINYNTVSPLTASRTTLMNDPWFQPTSLSFSSSTASSISGSFTPADGSPFGYVILRKAGSLPSSIPIDGTMYSVGATLGDATVVSVNSSTTFTDTGLSSGTIYHYAIFTYNGTSTAINYNTSEPLTGNRSTLTAEPTAQPTALSFSNVVENMGVTTMDVSFTAASGVDGYIVLRRLGSAPSGLPSDGTVYSSGTDIIGDGNVVYVGSGTSFSQTSLAASTIYHYAVFSYRGSGSAVNYLTSSPLTGSRTTLASDPGASVASNLTFPAFTTNSLNGSFSSTAVNGYLVLQRVGASPTGVPVDGIPYSVDDIIGDGKVVSIGATTTFSASSLTPNTVYHYDVISYNGSGLSINYSSTARLEGSRTTLQTEPASQATNITFNNITISSLQSLFTAATGSPAGYLVLRREGAATTASPVDGSTYTVGNTIGDGTVVHSGSATTFTDAGLAAGKVYHYSIFSYNGSVAAINYLEAGATTNSAITISPAPAANIATNVLQTSFQANWASVTGAANYVLDVSLDNFSNMIAGYAGKTISGLNDAVTGLTPGTTYQYRVRASNASGLSGNSNTISQITIPATPVAATSGSPGVNDFTASWTAVPGVTGYELDVSVNDFVSYITGYQAKALPSTVTQEFVSPLSASTEYKYRLRSVNAAGVSPNSSVVTVTTASVAGTQLSLNQVPQDFALPDGQASATISVEVTGGVGTKTVELFYKKIRSSGSHASKSMSVTTGDTYSTSLASSDLDELGAEFYIRASDQSANQPKISAVRYVYKSVPGNASIPGLSFGGEAKNYRIISIPYDLDQPNTPIVFSTLGAYDKTQWRLLQYSNEKYSDNPSNIAVGKGYWFNAREQATIELGAGTVSQNNQDNPFEISLQQGWNMVATPFPFSLSWTDILEHNGDPDVGEYHSYTGTQYQITDNLEPWKGGFVFADANTVLSVPVTLGLTGTRLASKVVFYQDPEDGNWLIPVTLEQGEIQSTLQAFGMHEDASVSKDRFDAVALPAFLDFAELTSEHKEYFSPRFMRDVVPLKENYIWSFNLTSSSKEDITLRWDNKPFQDSRSQILLYDAQAGQLIDMRATNTYATSGNRIIEFIFSRDEKYTSKRELGKAYPNPFTQEIQLPAFLNTQNGEAVVSVTIRSLTGIKVYSNEWRTDTEGLIQPTWEGKDPSGNSVAAGVYLYQLKFSNSKHTITSQGKIIKH